jgi:hypothetical protein
MNADELRRFAELVDHDQLSGNDATTLFRFLRACADALDAGPVAWEHNGFVSANKGRVEHDEMKNRSCGFKAKPILALYPLAMPAQAQPLRLPEPMTSDALNEASSRLRDDLLDHIYEYTTISEGILPRVLALCRAVESETLRRVKEANK